MASISDKIMLNNKVEMPALGFGVCLMPDGQETANSVRMALKAGYRNLDTAAAYGNERGVGMGIRQAMEEYGINREEIFLSTKAWHTMRGYDKTMQAFEESMEKLGLEYLDLYMIHWPAVAKWHDDWRELNADTWRALEELYRSGRVKAIGMSNFLTHHLQALMEDTEITPMVNQIELHPGFGQFETMRFCLDNGIAVEAWSPFGRAAVLQNETIVAIAQAHGKTAAQVCLRWLMDKGVVPLPKSTHEERIISNTQVFDFSLTAEEAAMIDNLPYIGGMQFNPDEAMS